MSKVKNPERKCRICGNRCEKQMRYCKLCARERKREIDELKKQVGNAAKLREALITIRDKAYEQYVNDYGIDTVWIQDVANAALAAPPRNCDRPECATSKAAQAVWRKEDGGKTGYHVWLLAPATEKKGGHDGNE